MDPIRENEPTQSAAPLERQVNRESLDRRRAERDARSLEVRLRFVAAEAPGTTADISGAGALVAVEGEMRVEFRVEGGSGEWRRGRLVRAQPTGDGRMAVAIQFDSAPERS